VEILLLVLSLLLYLSLNIDYLADPIPEMPFYFAVVGTAGLQVSLPHSCEVEYLLRNCQLPSSTIEQLGRGAAIGEQNDFILRGPAYRMPDPYLFQFNQRAF
jgi:hypothetical protein